MGHASVKSLLLLACLAPAVAPAQAWLPDKGTLKTSLMFNNQLYSAHWSSTGDTLPGINVRADTLASKNGHKVDQSITVGISYGYRPRAEAAGVAATESNGAEAETGD